MSAVKTHSTLQNAMQRVLELRAAKGEAAEKNTATLSKVLPLCLKRLYLCTMLVTNSGVSAVTQPFLYIADRDGTCTHENNIPLCRADGCREGMEYSCLCRCCNS